MQPGISQFQLVPSTLQGSANSEAVTIDLINMANNQLFVVKLTAVKDDKFHVEIDEKAPLKARYRVDDALKDTPVLNK